MAITLTPSAVSVPNLEYYHTKSQFPIGKSFPVTSDSCCFGACEMPLPVFADLDNETISRRNDISKFIFEVPTGGSVICTLTNISTSTDYLITDTTYGAFADVGDIATRPLVWSFVVNWFKIATLLAYGNYKLNFVIKNSSATIIFNETTPCYYLRPYSCESAADTVRLSVTQVGYNPSDFNWSGMTGLAGLFKPQQIRLYGSIDKIPVSVSDYIANSGRKDSHVQSSIHHDHELALNFISNNTYNSMVKGMLLEGEITVESYNPLSPFQYENYKCSFVELVKDPQIPKYKQINVVVRLTDATKNNIKRYGS